MKRLKKKELLKMISSLEEITRLISNNLKDNIPASAEILAQCQDASLIVGTAIEETYGESGKSIVAVLEDYCESLYQISIVEDQIEKRKKLAKKAKKQIITIHNEVSQLLPEEKKEVVFLPYKASMWDSLESVWKAAAQDEGCNAYVIPIPYFDRNPDGSLGQMHYEGGEYPDDVPVTSWEEYSIPERMPDVIYIHNPYDHCNYVTSVHPDFYASNLKKYTDMLVYIPYFIAVNEMVSEHFCVTPGVLYADKVVVQSEKVRQTYIKELRKYEKENHCKDAFGKLQDKVLALGSPKYDKITAEEEYVIPDEWEKRIVNQDGSRKKVILYNTTIDAMLRFRKKMMDKIRRTLEILKDSQEIVLLWRPHPLLKTTLESMSPELLSTYIQIETQYREQGWGIYDDTADLYRAIALSNAYYGDWSSVVELYKQTGKPIMIQNIEV